MSSLTSSSADEDSADEFDCLPALRLLHLTDDFSEDIQAVSGAGKNAATSLPESSSAPTGSLPPSPTPSPVDPSPQTPSPVNPSPPPSPAASRTSPGADGMEGDPESLLLTQERLQGGLRVLIGEDGVFHGGSVTDIRPPDIYGVVVDGERGSRPRILSTEELLEAGVS